MSNFKLSWRLIPALYVNQHNWESFLRLIDNNDKVADEVDLYITDDVFPDLTPLDDKRKQAEICKKRFADLRQRGLRVSIIIWPSFNLYAVEQKFFPNMQRMVDIKGNVIKTIACPISDEFVDYMQKKIAIFADIKPDLIWIDDDFRFTHMKGEYPCFCDKCVKGFKSGAFASREELVSALGREENRELRVEWSAYGADRLAKLCSSLRFAVEAVSPETDLAFMTVGATHTTFSGDYINKCMTALKAKSGRPGHDFYSDRSPDKIMWKMLEAGRQVTEYPSFTTDILWEEDSHPQGYLRKSFHSRQNEISLGLMAGCTGIAFNHTATIGNLDESLKREAEELSLLRPRWERFLEFSKELDWAGMWPLHSWFLTAKAKPEYAWLKEDPFGEAKDHPCDITLPGKIGPLGIALTADPKNASATLLSGKTLTALDENELKKVFSGNVYMDASALSALEELGLEKWAGVKVNPNHLPSKPCVMTDHPFNGAFASYSYRGTDNITANTLIPLDNTVEWLGYRANVFGEGDFCYISKYKNALGGKVIVNGYDAWEFPENPNNLYQFSSMAEWFDCPIRLRFKNSNIVSRVQPYIRLNDKKAAVMLLNASFDTTNPFEIIIKGEMTKAVLITRDNEEINLDCYRENNHLCVNIPTIDMWDIAFVLAE